MNFDVKEIPVKIDYSDTRSYLIGLEKNFAHLIVKVIISIVLFGQFEIYSLLSIK